MEQSGNTNAIYFPAAASVRVRKLRTFSRVPVSFGNKMQSCAGFKNELRLSSSSQFSVSKRIFFAHDFFFTDC